MNFLHTRGGDCVITDARVEGDKVLLSVWSLTGVGVAALRLAAAFTGFRLRLDLLYLEDEKEPAQEEPEPQTDDRIPGNTVQEVIAEELRRCGDNAVRDPLWAAEQVIDAFRLIGWKVVANPADAHPVPVDQYLGDRAVKNCPRLNRHTPHAWGEPKSFWCTGAQV